MPPRKPFLLVLSFAALLAGLWFFTRPRPAKFLPLRQLTFDKGLTGSPAISADGRTIVYSSDRAGPNLDLYQQPVGGDPERLTETPEDESEVVLSPDGSEIAFHSTVNGGGIYTMPAHGGETKLLAAEGHHPRYSPDGRWIAFQRGDAMFVIARGAGEPRRIAPETPVADEPAVWSPDSRVLMLEGQTNIWNASLEGGPVVASDLPKCLAQSALKPHLPEDANWVNGNLIFTARIGTARNLYRCPFDRDGHPTGAIVRLTDRSDSLGDAAVSANGRVVLAAEQQRFDIWGLTLDPATGRASGAPYRITDTPAPNALPALSPDGHKLLFNSSRNGFAEVWLKDLSTGQESVVGTGPSGASKGRFLKSSGAIIYHLGTEAYESGRKIAGGIVEDVDRHDDIALLSGEGSIDAVSLKTEKRATVLRAAAPDHLGHPRFSPDDRWIVFRFRTRIFTAPARGLSESPAAQWIPVTGATEIADKPVFSPDGRKIYFTLDQDGKRVIRAVAFDPSSGKTAGPPFDVWRSAQPELSLEGVSSLAFDMTLARDRLVLLLAETKSNLWLGDLVLTP